MGLPIIFIQFLTIYAAKKMMDKDRAWITNVREEDKKYYNKNKGKRSFD